MLLCAVEHVVERKGDLPVTASVLNAHSVKDSCTIVTGSNDRMLYCVTLVAVFMRGLQNKDFCHKSLPHPIRGDGLTMYDTLM